MHIDTYYFIIIVPALILSIYAQFKVKNTYAKYLQIPNGSGITGADAARRILDIHGLHNVEIEMIDGYLSDHYDPKSRTIRLSKDVYHGVSLSSLGVAAHETGHAIQHSQRYIPLSIRNSLVPVASVGGNWVAIPLIIAGFTLQSSGLFLAGIILFTSIVAFQFITLPVEFNASTCALNILSNGFLTQRELSDTKKVLNAAALTYVTASTAALAELIRFIFAFINSLFKDD